MRTQKSRATAFCLVAALAAGGAQAQNGRQQEKPYTTWRTYGGAGDASQYSALNQINKSNVTQLTVAWSFPVGERSFVFNPVVVDNVMYVLARDNDIVALDAATGRELWSHPHEGPVTARGINYWQSADGNDRRLLYLNAGMLTALNARTGQTITTFGKNGFVDLRDGLGAGGWNIVEVRPLHTSNPGRVIGNLMVVSLPAQGAGYASTPGDVQAYDVVTGKLAWVFHSVPHEGEFGYDTWPKEGHATAGGVHNWSELTVDEANGIVFVPFGTARYDFFGGNRAGNNLYANSLVAIDARNGKRLWHQQLVHHDLWDYDLPQAPKLLTIRDGRRTREVVAQATKHGFLFVFDRKSGEPIWPIEERAVPQSDVPGEHTSPTQPFPTKPEPFARQSFTERDINPYLPAAEQDVLRQKLRSSRNEGLFTPPSFVGSIGMPGHNGGANWASSAVDPINGELYIVSKNLPVMMRVEISDDEPSARTVNGPVVTREEAAKTLEAAKLRAAAAGSGVRYSVPYDFLRSQTNGMGAFGAPFSELTAYDLNTGEIKWRVPDGGTIGIGDDVGAHFSRGAPLVTAGGLVFAATAQDRKLRAYDRDNGKVLWSYTLPGGSEGIPATYQLDGRQYLAVPVAAGAGLFAPLLDPAPPQPPLERAY
ncbi:MAG TPA: PQQ-binding-like beta-propeller repeat protein, partial [Gammaproteobacteria bacterium]|nr:PQQ-binding-like beta-propeller repeat protein [Gammaproteobacteria bacterium]